MRLSYSVVIPAYNATRTLSASLECVMHQSLPALEVIVVDDGSTDGTAELARGFTSVRVISQQNGGPGPACNTGVALAQGDVLTFLDADDLWTPNAMQAQISALCRNEEAHAVVGDMEEFVCAGETIDSAARFAPRARQTGWISGATAIRAASFRRVGTFRRRRRRPLARLDGPCEAGRSRLCTVGRTRVAATPSQRIAYHECKAWPKLAAGRARSHQASQGR